MIAYSVSAIDDVPVPVPSNEVSRLKRLSLGSAMWVSVRSPLCLGRNQPCIRPIR